MINFDVFITATEKDFNKIPYVVDHIRRNIIGHKNIIFCSPTEIPYDVKQVRDKEVLDIDPTKMFKYRPFWIYQQFIKLFQEETTTEYFLTLDCDTIINKPLSFFECINESSRPSKLTNDYVCNFIPIVKPIWYVGWEQNHSPYYNYNWQMFGFGREVDHTFLADMNFFNSLIIKEMLFQFNYTRDSFIEKSAQIISDKCFPSEADIYGNYCALFNKNLYIIKRLKTECVGKAGLWTNEEIENRIASRQNSDLDTYSLHSWT